MKIDNNIIDSVNLKKIQDLQNDHVEEILEYYVNLCKPSKVTIIELFIKNGKICVNDLDRPK